MKPHEELERYKKLRSITANRTDNIYELIRMRIVRVMRECEDVSYAAEELGCSRATVRRYMNFVPFEHLMRDPSLEKRFDWRSMTEKKWTKLLRKHPEFIHTRTGPEFLTAVITTMAADLAGAAGKPAISEEGELLRARLDAAVFGTVPSLEELAVAISKSRAQTIRIFRRDFGETPLQYLLDRKMEAARELLASTRTPIKELAAMLGFTDPYHFAALFRRRNGLPPGRYRTVSANSGTGRPTGADRTPPDRSA